MELFPGDQMVVEKNTDQVFIREYQAIQNGLRRISGKTKKTFTIRKISILLRVHNYEWSKH